MSLVRRPLRPEVDALFAAEDMIRGARRAVQHPAAPDTAAAHAAMDAITDAIGHLEKARAELAVIYPAAAGVGADG